MSIGQNTSLIVLSNSLWGLTLQGGSHSRNFNGFVTFSPALASCSSSRKRESAFYIEKTVFIAAPNTSIPRLASSEKYIVAAALVIPRLSSSPSGAVFSGRPVRLVGKNYRLFYSDSVINIKVLAHSTLILKRQLLQKRKGLAANIVPFLLVREEIGVFRSGLLSKTCSCWSSFTTVVVGTSGFMVISVAAANQLAFQILLEAYHLEVRTWLTSSSLCAPYTDHCSWMCCWSAAATDLSRIAALRSQLLICPTRRLPLLLLCLQDYSLLQD